jgi:hypothetical protein
VKNRPAGFIRLLNPTHNKVWPKKKSRKKSALRDRSEKCCDDDHAGFLTYGVRFCPLPKSGKRRDERLQWSSPAIPSQAI